MSNLFSYETAWLKGKNGSTGNYKFTCTVDLNSQSIENNTSNITVKITLKGESNSGTLMWEANATKNQPYGKITGDVEQDGSRISKYNKSTTPITVVAKTLDIEHDADGTKSLSIAFGWVAGELNYYPATQTFTTASITLPTIARASSIVGENALITDDSGSLAYTITSASAFYHKLILSFNGHTETLLSAQRITSTYNGTVSYSNLLNWLGDVVSASLTFTLHTYSDSATTNLIGTKTATYTVVNASIPNIGNSKAGIFPRLFRAGATEFDNNGITTLTDVLSCIITEERNGPFELEMVIASSTPYFERIKIGELIVVKPNHTQPPQAFEIYEIGRPINKKVVIKAYHVSYRANFIPVLPFTATGIDNSIIGLNTNALEQNPFVIATDITNTESVYKQKEPQSLRARLGGSEGSLLDTFGGEYLWNNFSIILMQARGLDNGVQLRVGKNITDLNQTLNFDRVITGVLPYWKSSEDETVVYGEVQYSSSVDSYAYARTSMLDLSADFESEPSVSDLNTRASNYVSQSKLATPLNNIKVKFIDLADTEEYKESLLERVNLCDIVTVVYEDLGISYKAKVVKLKYDPISDRTIEAEIGDARSSLAQTIQGLIDTTGGVGVGGGGSNAYTLFSYPQSRPESANDHQYFDGTLFHYLSTGSMATGKPAGNGHIIEMQWDSDANLGTELYLRATGTDHSSLGVRGSGASAWNEWAYADLRRQLWTGTTAGQGGKTISLNVSGYSFIRLWVMAYDVCFHFDIDLTTAPQRTIAGATGNTAYRGSGVAPLYTTGASTQRIERYYCMAEVNSAKDTVSIVQIGYEYSSGSRADRNGNTAYYVYKIEGYL